MLRPTITRSILWPTVLITGLAACTSDDAPDLGTDEDYSQCGGTWDVQNVESYDGTLGVSTAFVARHQRRVGMQIKGGIGWCSGTLVSDDLFLSAGHCSYVVGETVRFNHQNAPDGTARTTRDFTVSAVVEQELGSGWDYAIVRLNGSPGRTYGHASIAAVDPTAGTTVTIIGHPSGVPKVVHAGPVHDYSSGQGTNYFRYQVDTVGGSSGAGVLDLNGEVVGVHTNAGCATTNPVGGNSGMRMSQLIPHSATLRALTRSKILWRNAPGNQASIWSLNADGTQHADSGAYSVGADWTPLSMSDNHVLWRHTSGKSSYWTINDAGQHLNYAEAGPWAGWTPVNHANDRVLWRSDSGMAWLATVDSVGQITSAVAHGPFAGWTPIAYANNQLLWRHTAGDISLWHLDDNSNMIRWASYAVPAAWTFVSMFNGEIFWRDSAGVSIQYLLNPLDDIFNTVAYGPYSPYQVVAGADRKIIWSQPSGLISYWTVNSDGIHMRYREHGPFGTWMATLTAGGRP